MVIVWILFVLYVLLLVYKLVPDGSKGSWTKIRRPTVRDVCKGDDDCDPYHKCHDGECLPMMRGSKCNPATGTWMVVTHGDQKFVKCTCTHPHLITQKWDGADCDMEVACGKHGKLNSRMECECDIGYEAVGHDCIRKLPAMDGREPCEDDEIDRKKASKFYKNLFASKCFKKPCSYNAFNGNPLRHSHLGSRGCVCNPEYGNFGVRFITPHSKVEGYEACANVYEDEPSEKISTSLYNYFYVTNKDPVAFVKFDTLDKERLVPQLRNHAKDTIQISEDIRDSYAQHVFDKLDFDVHVRECYYSDRILGIETCDEFVLRNRQMTKCEWISNNVNLKEYNSHINAYRLLYMYPVCFYSDPPNKTPTVYDKLYVSNPYHVMFQDHPTLLRSNGIVLTPHNQKWLVQHAAADMAVTSLDLSRLSFPEMMYFKKP